MSRTTQSPRLIRQVRANVTGQGWVVGPKFHKPPATAWSHMSPKGMLSTNSPRGMAPNSR